MDEEHGHGHGHQLLGLPVIVWVAGVGLLALFIFSHRASTVSGVTLPSTTQADLANSQDAAAQLGVQAQQEALAAKTATDAFNLQASQASFGQQLVNSQQQQTAQASANALALQGGAQQLQFNALNQQLGLQAGQQQLAQNAGQYNEQQQIEQAAYRNMHQGGFTLGTFAAGATQLANAALGVYKAVAGLPSGPAGGSTNRATAPFVPAAGIPPTS